MLINNPIIVGDKPLIDPALTDPTQGNSVTKRVGGKLVLRPSSINIHCPYSYAQNAILGKKSKPSGASQGGTSYHYALELGYEHKIQLDSYLPASDLVEIGVTNWKYAVDTQDMHYAVGDNADRMTDNIAEGLKAYAPVMERVEPIATEIRWSAALPKPSSVYSQISGSVDLLVKDYNPLGGMTEGVKIIDHKFTSKAATEPKYRMQAGLYKLMGLANGVNVTSTALHNMVRGRQLKTKYKPTSLEIVRPTDDKGTDTLIRSRLNELIDRGEMHYFLTNDMGIDPEDSVKVLYPTVTPEVSYLCSELWCGWWASCPINNPANGTSIDLVDMLSKFRERTNANR